MNNAQKLENTFFVNVWACVCVCACGIIYFFCIIIMTNLLNADQTIQYSQHK